LVESRKGKKGGMWISGSVKETRAVGEYSKNFYKNPGTRARLEGNE